MYYFQLGGGCDPYAYMCVRECMGVIKMSRVLDAKCTRTVIEGCDLNCIRFTEWGVVTVCPELEVETNGN